MFKKPFAGGILLLFLLSTLFPILSGAEILSDKIIYVDDDGTADYTKIQDAIDNASVGDTVFDVPQYVLNEDFFTSNKTAIFF